MSKPQEDMRLIDLDLAMLKNWILDSGFIKPIFFDSVNQTTAVFMIDTPTTEAVGFLLHSMIAR